MRIKGKIWEIGEIQNINETFKKRDLIIEYAENPTYPEYVKFEFLKDKVQLVKELKRGDEVELEFSLRGRPWTNREGVTSYHNGLVVYSIIKL